MDTCRFCNIANGINKGERTVDTILTQTNDYFAISSIGALVEGWTLIVPRKHCCSMKNLYEDKEFAEFANKVITALRECYGPVIAFEHGPNREGSATSCGTDHAHIHLVPYSSLATRLNAMEMEWEPCCVSEVKEKVGDAEYLFYVDVADTWEKSQGKVHILEKPVSQFFRKVIADDLGIGEKYNYKTNPDTELTLKTITRMSCYFGEKDGG